MRNEREHCAQLYFPVLLDDVVTLRFSVLLAVSSAAAAATALACCCNDFVVLSPEALKKRALVLCAAVTTRRWVFARQWQSRVAPPFVLLLVHRSRPRAPSDLDVSLNAFRHC